MKENPEIGTKVKYYIVKGLHVSLPDKKEQWHELESYATEKDAIDFCERQLDPNTRRICYGYQGYEIIERIYSDKSVWNKTKGECHGTEMGSST